MKLEQLTRIAALALLIGLVVEIVSLLWSHPLSFLLFTTIGGLALVVGIALYLRLLTVGVFSKRAAEKRSSQ